MRVVRSPTARNWEQREGVSVMASSNEKATATDTVTPNWKKNFPMIPFMKATGRKMAMMAAVAAMAAKVISRAPSMAALSRLLPASACRYMFSSTMMASSTTIPTDSDSPSSVKVLSVNPQKYITAKVPMMEVGMESSTLKVEEREPRKSQQTSPVRMTERMSVNSISWIDSSTGAV